MPDFETKLPKIGLLMGMIFLSFTLTGAYPQRLFWEQPQVLMEEGARFPRATSGGKLIAVVWQEFVASAGGREAVHLSMMTSRDARSWQTNRHFAGPFSYQDKEVPIFSVTADNQGRIFLAIAESDNITKILSSGDQGQSFEHLADVPASTTAVAPRIFVTSQGSLLLLVTQKRGLSLAVHYSWSRDGRSWSPLQPLITDPDIPINFLPQHSALGDTEYVICQALSRDISAYQLYLISSRDGGITWDGGLILDFDEPVGGSSQDSADFSNQRPFITPVNGGGSGGSQALARIGLAWERQLRGGKPRIYYAELAPSGSLVDTIEPITEASAAAYAPRIVRHRDRIYLFWFDNRRGQERVFAAGRGDAFWMEEELSGLTGISTFPWPIQLGDLLYVFWENRSAKSTRLIVLQPDQTVSSPIVRPLDFDPGQPSRKDTIQVRWNVPADSSGIYAFDYLWSRDPREPLALREKLLVDTTTLELEADGDGIWYLRVAAVDTAGNWSEPGIISYTRDTTPPGPVEILEPEQDEDGFLISNTFQLNWEPPPLTEGSGQPGELAPTESLAGYTYSLEYLGSEEFAWDREPTRRLPQRVLTDSAAAAFNNRDNGIWAFSVAAVDRAGNVGETETLYFGLNKYIPVTYITSVGAALDPRGALDLRIFGRGFREGGLIRRIILDRNGVEPYDYVFSQVNSPFIVRSDRLIDNLKLISLEDGLYRVGLEHPSRGLYFTRPTLKITAQGTVKFGNFAAEWQSPWQSARLASRPVTVSDLLIWLVVGFLGLLGLVSLRKMASLSREGQLLKEEVIAVLRGERGVWMTAQRMKALERRGVGLRLKFTLLTTILVIITVLMISIPLSYYMINTQQQNLAEGLIQRTEVFLGSLASGAEVNLPRGRDAIIELGQLPKQISAMEEALFATLSGAGEEDAGNLDYVWATNDPGIRKKIGGLEYRPGQVRISDDITPIAGSLEEQVNTEARTTISDLAVEADRISTQARALALSRDVESRRRLEELTDAFTAVNTRILDELQGIGSALVGSSPSFDAQRLLPFYTFYRPIIYRVRGEELYYRGIVRLGVSTERIVAQISSSRKILIIRTGIIALIATGLGVVGAIIMASITINPIKKLAAGVAVIRDTEDKEALKEHHIDVRTRDEIGMLATTVNQMTQGLVKAAAANKELIVGKEVQKMFIPLTRDESGRKGTIGEEKSDRIEIFGYYEGAKGVSGDYFDYVKLSDRYYAMIKCDVAGKGVPAALIMVEVSTIFSTFFRNWTAKAPGLDITKLAYQINDLLEERGFKGRFAALTLCILDTQTGKSYFCNAGDTNLHIFRNDQGKMVELKLPESPAAGVFPSMMVEMQAGFKQVPHQLSSGDTLFLFTDGVEESKRTFRDGSFQLTTCQESGLEENAEHGGTHRQGSESEELGIPRLHAIINAVFNRKEYRLFKFHNPIPEEELVFDFTSCEGSVEEAVKALVAVEKIFRVYPDPSATGEDRLRVDKPIDQFLRRHFVQYHSYFGKPLEAKQEANTVTYSHLKEDEQYDDITILAVRKL